MPEPTRVSNLNLEIRPIRYRYPMSSEQFNDMFDMLYWNMVELLGYEDINGNTAPSGVLMELYADVNTYTDALTGISASGYTHALTLSSGSIDNIITVNNSAYNEIAAMIKWYT